MKRINDILPKVKPVVIPISGRQDEPGAIVSYQRRVARQRRRIIFVSSHIGKEEPSQLANRIRWVVNLLAKSTSGWLEGLLKAIALHIIKPAVIETANPFFFDITIFQRAAAMRTVQSYKPHPALSSSRQHQLFASNLHR